MKSTICSEWIGYMCCISDRKMFNILQFKSKGNGKILYLILLIMGRRQAFQMSQVWLCMEMARLVFEKVGRRNKLS